MKLIDLLVRELPKRGGWPEGFVTAWQSEHDCEVYFCKPDNSTTLNTRSLYVGLLNEASDCRGIRGSVTSTQYEAALAAKNAPAWNGKGLPPVGCECERKFTCHDDANWEMIKIMWAGDDEMFYEYIGKNFNGTKQYHSNVSDTHIFRPIKSEADKKRDVMIDYLQANLPDITYTDCVDVYNLITSGTMPGVKLED